MTISWIGSKTTKSSDTKQESSEEEDDDDDEEDAFDDLDDDDEEEEDMPDFKEFEELPHKQPQASAVVNQFKNGEKVSWVQNGVKEVGIIKGIGHSSDVCLVLKSDNSLWNLKRDTLKAVSEESVGEKPLEIASVPSSPM